MCVCSGEVFWNLLINVIGYCVSMCLCRCVVLLLECLGLSVCLRCLSMLVKLKVLLCCLSRVSCCVMVWVVCRCSGLVSGGSVLRLLYRLVKVLKCLGSGRLKFFLMVFVMFLGCSCV